MDLTDLKVLIVEDSPTQALMLQESLQEKKLKTVTAKDGVEGLALMRQESPQIVVSDIEMPRKNGFEFCREAKNDPKLKDTPVIMLTNLSDPMDLIKGLQSGADGFLTKPCPIDLLLATISDTLENKKLHSGTTKNKISFIFRGKHYQLEADQSQIVDLLLSTYSNALQKNLELEQAYRQLNMSYQEIEQKNEELKKLNEQKNQFLGMAAHDLRNPLSVIQGFSSLLEDKFSATEDKESIKMLERIQKSSTFMINLINDLLDISSIESGKVHLNLQDVNLTSLIEEHISFMKGIAQKKEISLVFKAGSIRSVVCDPEKILQVVNNLITNAIKFSKPQTTVEVTLESKGSDIVITVKDQGVGIPAQERDRLFQPFSKTSVKSTAGEASTGLGLAIAKKIMTEHKGKIWVESEVGKGSTFSVSLPATTSE